MEVDTNLDGIKDVMRTFNERANLFTKKLTPTTTARSTPGPRMANGRLASQFLTTRAMASPMSGSTTPTANSPRIQRDTNKDGNPDVWEIYAMGHLERVGVDVDFDGHVDRWDRDEYLVSQQKRETPAPTRAVRSLRATQTQAPHPPRRLRQSPMRAQLTPTLVPSPQREKGQVGLWPDSSEFPY